MFMWGCGCCGASEGNIWLMVEWDGSYSTPGTGFNLMLDEGRISITSTVLEGAHYTLKSGSEVYHYFSSGHLTDIFYTFEI